MTKPVHILKNKIAYIFPFCDSSLTPGIAMNGELRIKQHSKCSRGRGWLAEIIDGETLLIINTYITCFLWSNEPIVGWINISDTNGKQTIQFTWSGFRDDWDSWKWNCAVAFTSHNESNTRQRAKCTIIISFRWSCLHNPESQNHNQNQSPRPSAVIQRLQGSPYHYPISSSHIFIVIPAKHVSSWIEIIFFSTCYNSGYLSTF